MIIRDATKARCEHCCESWKAYFRIPERKRWNIAHWSEGFARFSTRGVGAVELCRAISVMAVVRRRLLPLSDRLLQHGLVSCSFLVHNRESGVPSKDDRRWLDASLHFSRQVDARRLLPCGWKFVRQNLPPPSIAGINPGIIRSQEDAERLITEQSMWYTRLIGFHEKDVSDMHVLLHVAQYLHYFSNMSGLIVT